MILKNSVLYKRVIDNFEQPQNNTCYLSATVVGMNYNREIFSTPSNFFILEDLWKAFHEDIPAHPTSQVPELSPEVVAKLTQKVYQLMVSSFQMYLAPGLPVSICSKPQYLEQFNETLREPRGSLIIRHSLAHRIKPCLDQKDTRWANWNTYMPVGPPYEEVSYTN